MKHIIRQHGQIQSLDCEIGSGMKDKNDIEIFENDIVRINFDRLAEQFIRGYYFKPESFARLVSHKRGLEKLKVSYWHTGFALSTTDGSWLCDLDDFYHCPQFIEVIGHVEG